MAAACLAQATRAARGIGGGVGGGARRGMMMTGEGGGGRRLKATGVGMTAIAADLDPAYGLNGGGNGGAGTGAAGSTK